MAGIRGTPLPLTGDAPPTEVHLAGSESVSAVASVLLDALAEHSALLLTAVALAAAAALLPEAARRGAWGLAAWGAALLAATLLPTAELAAAPVVLGVWATCGVLTLRSWT